MNLRNLLFVPIDLDIPDVPIGEIKVTHIRPDYSPWWEFEQLLDKNNIWKEELNPYQIFLKELALKLPITEYHNVRFTRQVDVVKPHIDVWEKSVDNKKYLQYLSSEPCGYRFVLSGSTNTLKVKLNEKIFDANIPSVPCLYVINSTEAVHFLNHDVNRITLYVRGLIDSDKHEKLLEKSLTKYKDYAIWKS